MPMLRSQYGEQAVELLPLPEAGREDRGSSSSAAAASAAGFCVLVRLDRETASVTFEAGAAGCSSGAPAGRFVVELLPAAASETCSSSSGSDLPRVPGESSKWLLTLARSAEAVDALARPVQGVAPAPVAIRELGLPERLL